VHLLYVDFAAALDFTPVLAPVFAGAVFPAAVFAGAVFPAAVFAGAVFAAPVAAGGGGAGLLTGLFPLTTLDRKVSNMDFMVARSAGLTPAPFMTSKTTPLKSSKFLSVRPIL